MDLKNIESFLERVVMDLVVRMGYGGSRKDAGGALGRSGDEGIDGIIKEDPLGLHIIYLQAKRWEGTVGRPEIQKFAGALQGQKARKGIFITTSTFSSDALEYTSKGRDQDHIDRRTTPRQVDVLPWHRSCDRLKLRNQEDRFGQLHRHIIEITAWTPPRWGWMISGRVIPG